MVEKEKKDILFNLLMAPSARQELRECSVLADIGESEYVRSAIKDKNKKVRAAAKKDSE